MRTIFEPQEVNELAEVIVEKVTEALKDVIEAKSQADEILNPDQLANLLQIKKSQVYAWVNDAKYSENGIPFLKSGKFLRFSKNEILEWMRNGRNRCMRG